MRKIFFIVLLGTLFFFKEVQAQFVPGTEDIPLMPGLIVDENETVSFDTPAGQIVNIQAFSSQSGKDVRTFYHNTLTEMGWHAQNNTTYQRDFDELILTITSQQAQTLVHFQLTTPNN